MNTTLHHYQSSQLDKSIAISQCIEWDPTLTFDRFDDVNHYNGYPSRQQFWEYMTSCIINFSYRDIREIVFTEDTHTYLNSVFDSIMKESYDRHPYIWNKAAECVRCFIIHAGDYIWEVIHFTVPDVVDSVVEVYKCLIAADDIHVENIVCVYKLLNSCLQWPEKWESQCWAVFIDAQKKFLERCCSINESVRNSLYESVCKFIGSTYEILISSGITQIKSEEQYDTFSSLMELLYSLCTVVKMSRYESIVFEVLRCTSCFSFLPRQFYIGSSEYEKVGILFDRYFNAFQLLLERLVSWLRRIEPEYTVCENLLSFLPAYAVCYQDGVKRSTMAVLKEIKRIAIKKSPSNFNEGSYAAEDTFEEFLQCIKSLPVSSQVRVVNSVEDLFDGIKNLRVFSHGHIAQCALEQICKLSSCCDEAVSHNSTTDVHIRNMNSARMDACSAMREVENHRSSLTSANSQRGAMDLTSPPYAPYQSVGNRSSASDSNQSLAFRHTSSVLHKVEQSPSLGSDSKPLETNSKPEGRTGTSKNLTLTLTENGLRLSKPKVMTLSRQDVLPPNERKERKKDHYASDEKVVRTYRETRKMRQPLNNFSDLQYTAFDPDEFQTDGPNDFTRDLDKGYENYGQAPSDPSANKPKSKKIDLSKLLGSTKPDTPTVPYPLRIQETVPVSMQQNIRNVSIDSMFAKLLDLPLRTYCDNNFSSSDLKRVIKRFIDEESYINIFQPLLEAELEATLQDFISTDGAAARSVSGGQDKIRILGGADVLSARTNVPKIDIRFVGIFDRPSVLAPDGQDVFLQEVKVAILRRSKEVNLVRDDLVILLDSNNVKDFNSIKAILHETYTLGIVTSQGKDQNTPNLDNTVRTQLSMVVLPGRTPPQDVDWVCVPLIGLSTHLREWSALHSIRSHGLMPLTPYILQAAPVVSAHKLRIALSELTEHINSIATVRLSQGERAIMMALSKMKSFNVDFTVLKKTNIIKTLKGLEKMDYLSDSIKKELRSVHKMWKEKCQINNDKYTTGSLQGGNVVEIPSDIKNRPAQLSSMQWEVLKRLHNNSQLCAIKYVVGSADDTQDTRVTLVQGPPGTGKTMTVLGMIAALLHMRGSSGSTGQTSTSSRRNRLLVCAPSNAAVDEILTRLIDKGIADNKGNMITPKIVRLGKPLLGAPAEIEKLTLDNQVEAIVSKSHEWKSLLKASESIMHLQEQLDKLDSGFYAGDKCDARKKLREKLKESKRIKNTITLHITEVRTKARQKILEESDIVASTLSSSGQYVFLDHISQHNLLFETVLVDEAAQATEPATLIPLRYGCKRLVLVGDARQLPAFVCSRQAEVAGLGQSLFERLERCGHEIVMLKEQYRMHPEIRQFPSVQFYGGELTDAECIVEDINNSWKHNTIDSKSGVVCDVVRRGPLNPVMFFNLGGLEEAHRKSYLNRHEADFVLDFLTRMSDHFKEFTIAVITPYKSQVRLINDKIARAGVRHLSVEVNTVDGFQGREKDIVLFSAVRTRRVGFLSDYRRLNVAITRAKKCLVIVGHEPNLRSDTIWSNMIENLRERGYTHCASDVDVFSEFVFNTDTATDDACEDEDEAMEVTVREEEGEITSSTDRHSVQQKKRKRDVND